MPLRGDFFVFKVLKDSTKVSDLKIGWFKLAATPENINCKRWCHFLDAGL